MKLVDPERASYTARKVEVALLTGAFSEAIRIVEDDVAIYQSGVDLHELEEYVYAADMPLALSNVISPETLNILDERGFVLYAHIRDLTREELSQIPDLGPSRLDNLLKAKEELYTRWKEAKAAQECKKKRDYIGHNVAKAAKRDLILRQAEKEEARALKKAQAMLAKSLPKS